MHLESKCDQSLLYESIAVSDRNFTSLHWDVTCPPCTRVQVAWCWPPSFVVLARQAYTAGKLMNIMQQMYQSPVLPQNRDIEWPSRCHLSVCDCFLLWCLKSEVYVSHPRTFAELSSTSEKIVTVPVEIIKSNGEFVFQRTTVYTDFFLNSLKYA